MNMMSHMSLCVTNQNLRGYQDPTPYHNPLSDERQCVAFKKKGSAISRINSANTLNQCARKTIKAKQNNMI